LYLQVVGAGLQDQLKVELASPAANSMADTIHPASYSPPSPFPPHRTTNTVSSTLVTSPTLREGEKAKDMYREGEISRAARETTKNYIYNEEMTELVSNIQGISFDPLFLLICKSDTAYLSSYLFFTLSCLLQNTVNHLFSFLFPLRSILELISLSLMRKSNMKASDSLKPTVRKHLF